MKENKNTNIEFEEINEMDYGETADDLNYSSSGEKSIVVPLAIAGGVVVGVAALLYTKTKNIRREHAIKKLEKEGYKVFEPHPDEKDVVCDGEVVSEEELDEDEE